MFIRFKKHPGSKNQSVLLCENYREGKKINQKMVSLLGVSSDPQKLLALKIEGEALIAKIKSAREQPKTFPVPERSLSLHTREIARKNVGIRDTLGKLYNELGFHQILRGKKISETLKSVVLARFAEPSSKRKACSILERQFNENIALDAIYYMMDQLVENLEMSQKIVFQATKAATGNTIDLALFDVTTLHLETIAQDELRDFDYSKNHKMDTTQVTLALATTTTGLPIGYHLFPGNIAEVSTLMKCIDFWRETIAIRDIMIVGDRAMMSQENISQLQAAGLKYIIAYPMKKSSSSVKSTILNKMNYHEITIQNEKHLKQEIPLGRERLIVTFNERRRAKDEKAREKLIAKLQKKLGKTKNAKRLISNKGYLKYTVMDDTVHAEINWVTVEEDAQWDGLHGILSNSDLPGEQIMVNK